MDGDARTARTPVGRVHLGTRRKLLLSVAAVGTSAAVMAVGTYASFTASASRGHQVTTGVPQLVLGTTGAATNRLGIDALNLAPGESVHRSFDVTNGGSAHFTTVTLSSAATTSSILDTDTVHGLQAQLERCSVPWVESGTSPNFSYTCSGTRTVVVPFRPVTMTAVPLSGMLSVDPGRTDHLMLTEMLPATADNTFVNQMTALTFTINAS